jgi:hypothetical protein
MREQPLLPINYARPSANARWHRRAFETARWCAVGGWLAGAIAWAAVVALDAETTLVGGPLLCGVGVAGVVAGARAGFVRAAAAGAGHCLICLILFGLVQVFGWGPGPAREPFIAIGAVYLVLTVPLIVSIIATRYEPPPQR